MIAVDTNVLVYAHRREAREHAVAIERIRHLAEGLKPWAIPWPCIYEFISVVTRVFLWGCGPDDGSAAAPWLHSRVAKAAIIHDMRGA